MSDTNDRRLRIALCITELDVGGAERCLVELATRVDRRRFEPIVYCLGTRPANEQASCVPPLEDAGVPVRFLNASSARHAPRTLWRLRRMFKRDQPDLVQSFLFHGNILGRLAARLAGIKHVVSGIRVAEHSARWHLQLDRWTARFVERHVCVSESVARFTEDRVGIPVDRLVVIPNGVDPSAFGDLASADLTSLGVPEHANAMAFIGRLTHQKGVDWLLDMMPAFLEEHPDWHLLLVGEGPDRAALEEQTRRLELADRVTLAGWRADVNELLAASNMLVLPSRWEGMPNVVLQAMAAGLPVLSTQAEGVAELLGPLKDQQTAHFGNSNDWLAKMAALCQSEQLREQLGAANRLHVERYFTIDRAVKMYEDLWAELCRSGCA